MNTTTTVPMPSPSASAKKPQNVQKEDAMWLQKELINKNYTLELALRGRTTARSRPRSFRAT
ncbi:MAG: hypothetical protein U1F25_06745 [Rubrivivax sp.]